MTPACIVDLCTERFQWSSARVELNVVHSDSQDCDECQRIQSWRTLPRTVIMSVITLLPQQHILETETKGLKLSFASLDLDPKLALLSCRKICRTAQDFHNSRSSLLLSQNRNYSSEEGSLQNNIPSRHLQQNFNQELHPPCGFWPIRAVRSHWWLLFSSCWPAHTTWVKKIYSKKFPSHNPKKSPNW